MRTSGVILSLSLALLSASAPTVARTSILGWRIWSPTANKVSESATIDSISDNKLAMEAQGYTLVSSTVNDGLTIAIWSPTEGAAKRSPLLPESLPGAKRDLNFIPSKREPVPDVQDLGARDDARLAKRATDIQGRHCSTACGFQNFTKADTSDCISAYRKLYSTTGVFTLATGQALSATSDANKCSIWTVNHSGLDITYDYWDAAGTGQWLNGACLINQGATVGVCTYEGIGTNVTNGVYTAVCHPSFMTGNQP